MSDPEIRAYVEDLADRVPTVPAPLGDVLAGGRASVARRRRRRGAALVVGAVVTVAAAVAAPGLLVHQAPGDPGRVAGPQPSAAAELVAPAGTQYVGMDGVVVAVPESWVAAQQPLCSTPDQSPALSYVLLEPVRFAVTCPQIDGPAPDPSEPSGRVLIGPADSPFLTGACEADDDCLQLDGIVFDPRILDTDPDRDEILTTMRESLRRVPAGWATVPLWPQEVKTTGPGSDTYGPVSAAAYEEILAAAGLTDVVRIGDATRRETDPPQGTVVRVSVAPRPEAPDGMKLVGRDGVVVAVPDSWVGASEPNCGELPVPYFVLVEPGGSSLRSSSRCPHDRRVSEPADHVWIELEVCRYLDSRCPPASPTRLVLDDVAFDVRIADTNPDRDEILATMAASLRRLPAGYATVPLWPTQSLPATRGPVSSRRVSVAAYEEILEQAGLADVVQVDQDAFGVISVVPGPGTVVQLP